MVSNIVMVVWENDVYMCYRSSTKWDKNGVWFESKARVMIGIRKPSDFHKEAKTKLNFVHKG